MWLKDRNTGSFSLKDIIILTVFEWFVFYIREFERLFGKDRQFKKMYDDSVSPGSVLSATGDVYEEFIKLFPFVNSKIDLYEDTTNPEDQVERMEVTNGSELGYNDNIKEEQ
jgi:hypothetical protein